MNVEFGDYIIYVDESGDHAMTSINEQHPVFVLAFCIFKKTEYTSTVLTRVNQFKFKFWGHDLTILHNREIRKPEGDFAFLRVSEESRASFFEDLNRMMEELPFSIIATVIDKRLLKERYPQPHSPYETALKFCLERAYTYLNDLGATQKTTNIIVEQRGLNEDKDLELAFRRIIDQGNWHNARLPFDIKFANKKVNSCGLQVADLVAHPIGRHVLNPMQENRSFSILEKKIIGKNGRKDGYGLKIFPKA